jgi:5'-3' exonuclease
MSKAKNANTILIDNVILIDTSYTSFHRFFATLKWMSMVNPELYKENFNNPEYNWIDNKEFMEKYEKMYLTKIEKTVGKKVFNKSLIIFCMDTPKEQVWRTTDLKCDYKAERLDLSLKNNFKPVFKYTYNHLIPNILKEHNNIYKIRLDKLEADDIIGLVAKYIEEKYETKNVFIMSGDQDFYQLGRENVSFINYKTKKPIIFNKDEAKLELHKKILLGDKSDCIPSIFPSKFPVKLKKDLVESIETFNNFIKENKDIEDKYNQNIKLINFDYIPVNYKNLVIDEFNDILKKYLKKNKNILF